MKQQLKEKMEQDERGQKGQKGEQESIDKQTLINREGKI